jgi:hypothetical protein
LQTFENLTIQHKIFKKNRLYAVCFGEIALTAQSLFDMFKYEDYHTEYAFYSYRRRNQVRLIEQMS